MNSNEDDVNKVSASYCFATDVLSFDASNNNV